MKADPKPMDPEAQRARALARLDQDVVDLDDELRKLLAMVKYQREALQAMMTDGMGYKQLAVSQDVLKSLKELSTIFSVTTDCQVRLDKTQEIRSKKLDKNGYLRLARKLVMSLPDSERGHWISDLLLEHRAKKLTAPSPGGLAQIDKLIETFTDEEAQTPLADSHSPEASAVSDGDLDTP